MGRRALFTGVAVLVLGGMLLLVAPVRTWVLIVLGWRTTGETDIGQTCLDPAIGSGSLPEVAIPSGVLRVEVGEELQEALDEVGPDGTVLLAAGAHRGQSARPHSGQTVVGEPGATLVGDGAPFAFRSSASGVTIRSLVIEGFRPDTRTGVIHGEEGARAWVVDGNEIKANGEIGVVAKSGWRVTNNRIHHNGRYGLTGSGADVLIQGNEIACNAIELGSTQESAATKFVHTTGLVLAGNFVHDNLGNGLWVDINNLGAEIRDNRVTGNALAGIFIEISCGGLVTGNDVAGNGFGTRRPRGMNNSAIFVSSSPGVEITGNRVFDNAKGIGGLHWAHANRDAVDRCVPELRELAVHNNELRQDEGLIAGIDATINQGEVWSDWGNTFFDNHYEIGPEARFHWEGETMDFNDWKGLGLG